MMQVFSNNALTTLAAELSAVATSMTVTASTGFASITSPQFELVTLEVAPATREIVKVTARSGNTWTIARAQEGTTAVLWAAGSNVEARPTAGTLANLVQKDTASVVAGSSAVGSGTRVVALGTSASATGFEAIAIGDNAAANANYAAAVGSGATAPGVSGVAMGYQANASGQSSVSIGINSDATKTESTAIGSLAQATGTNSAAVGKSAAATGANAVALGASTAATDYGVAVGSASAASGQSGTAIGHGSAAGMSGFAAGHNAVAADNAAAVGASSKAFGSGSFGFNGGNAFSVSSIASNGFFSVDTDDWNDQSESSSAGTQAIFATPNMDLAVPPAWQASTGYTHGQIVRPTTGGDVQYRAWCGYDSTTLLHLTPTSGATEPTWPGDGGDAAINATDNAYWIGIDPADGYETESVPTWLEFWPSGIAFICQEYSATTGTPTVSVGTASAPTLILNAASVGITAAGQVFHFTMPNPRPRIPEGESILITLDGAASAGVMAGRFVFAGAFIATRSRA